MLLRSDLLAGLAGAAATVPLLALGLTVLRGRARAGFAVGADVMLAAVLGAAVVAAARGGTAPWRGVAAVEAVANAVLAIACLCAVLPPLTSRLGSTRWAYGLAALAGGAVILRGGLALALYTGLAVARRPGTDLGHRARHHARLPRHRRGRRRAPARRPPSRAVRATPWLVVPAACSRSARRSR